MSQRCDGWAACCAPAAAELRFGAVAQAAGGSVDLVVSTPAGGGELALFDPRGKPPSATSKPELVELGAMLRCVSRRRGHGTGVRSCHVGLAPWSFCFTPHGYGPRRRQSARRNAPRTV